MKLIGFIVVSVLAFQNSLADFPADIQRCKAKDTACIAKVTTEIIKNNPHGKKDLGLPDLEPLHINEIVVSRGGGSGGLDLSLIFKNMDVDGISKVTVDKVEGFDEDPETSKFEIFATIPSLILKGKYTADGKILVLPIQGNGDADITLDNVKIIAKFKPSVKKENEKIVVGVKKLKVKVDTSRMQLALTNLFNGDKALGDHTNTFLNENWKDIWSEVNPAINDAFTDVINNLLSSVLKKITYDEFYQKE